MSVQPNRGKRGKFKTSYKIRRIESAVSIQLTHWDSLPHSAILLVNIGCVEQGLILEAYQLEGKTNFLDVFPQIRTNSEDFFIRFDRMC